MVSGNDLKIKRFQKITVAKPKKIKNPIESVPKVSKTDEPTAGSFFILSRSTGIITPIAAATIKFKTIASIIVNPNNFAIG